MEQTLREITNTITKVHDERLNPIKSKKLVPLDLTYKENIGVRQQRSQSVKNVLSFKQCVSLSTIQLDFGPCLPSTIHQRIITITLNNDLPPSIFFSMQIINNNKQLDDLPQFVFAIKKDKQLEFTDCYKFKLNKKGKYDFVIGVKTPNIMINQQINSQLIIKWETLNKNDNTFKQINQLQSQYIVQLKQRPYLPQIQCTKQLILSENNKQLRVLKFSLIKSKLKKQVKIPFILKTQSKITLFSQLLGLQHQFSQVQKSAIQILPKQLILNGNGVFVMTFRFNFTQQMTKYLQNLQQYNSDTLPSYTLRRVLIMKVSQTNIHYHFPIELSFFLGNKSSSSIE